MDDWGFEGYDLSAFNAGGKSSKDKDGSGASGDSGASYGEVVVNDGPAKELLKMGYSGFMSRDIEQAKWNFEKAASLGNVAAMEIMGTLYGGMYLPETRDMTDKERFEIAFSWHKKAADLGFAEAQASIGTSYYWGGEFVKQDFGEAMKWLRMAAEQNNAKAQCFIGTMYLQGKGVDCDVDQAVHWLRLAASQGFVEAQKRLGVMLCMGYDIEQDIDEGVKWIREAADLCDNTMQLILGNMYFYGKYVDQDYEEAAKWYERASEKGKLFYYGFIAYDYWFGIGLKKDREAGREWYRLVGRGLPEARCRLGLMYKEGLGVPKDEKKAQELLKDAEKSGFAKEKIDPSVENAMLRFLNDARYVPSETSGLNTEFVAKEGPGKKLVEEAFHMLFENRYEDTRKALERAAMMGNLEVCVILSALYVGAYSGELRKLETSTRYTMAMKWLKKAADGGCVEAQARLGKAFVDGFYVEQDFDEAAVWLLVAADEGNATASEQLSKLHKIGKGVKWDPKESEHRYREAAERGCIQAMFSVGKDMLQGHVEERFSGEGEKMIMEAVEAGGSLLQFDLGRSYCIGMDVEQNYKEAAKWFARATKKETSRSYGLIADCLWWGICLKQDREEALKWFRLTGHGYPQAYYELGMLYKDGLGVPKNLLRAREYFRKAVAAGYREAEAELVLLSGSDEVDDPK